MTKSDPSITSSAVEPQTPEQIADYERYRTAELNRYQALVKVAARTSLRSRDDDPTTVREEP